MDQEDLKKLYLSVVLPVLDFACPTYHSLLTQTQSDKLEALQKWASKIIFGYGESYTDVINSGELQLLEERRRNVCLNFARRAAANKRFAPEWFP